MTIIQERTYDLSATTKIRLFRNMDAVHRHAKDHFLNPEEPWYRLLGVKFLRTIGKKLIDGSVSVVEKLYEKVALVVDEGIHFSSKLPVYVEFSARWRRTDDREGIENGFYFIAEFGFIVVVHGGVVRTAYFPSKHPKESYYTLFNEAWKCVRVRAARKNYIDKKGGRSIELVQVNRVSTDNWERCPNPHKRPRRERRQLPAGTESWLNEIEERFLSTPRNDKPRPTAFSR